MESLRILGLFTIIPATMLLTVSFFVMFALGKIEKSPLRVFGMVIVGLLWTAALVIFSAGVMIVSQGFCGCGNNMMKKSAVCPFSEKMNPHRGMAIDPYHHGFMMQGNETVTAPEPKK